jgi:hypothetical protein
MGVWLSGGEEIGPHPGLPPNPKCGFRGRGSCCWVKNQLVLVNTPPLNTTVRTFVRIQDFVVVFGGGGRGRVASHSLYSTVERNSPLRESRFDFLFCLGLGFVTCHKCPPFCGSKKKTSEFVCPRMGVKNTEVVDCIRAIYFGLATILFLAGTLTSGRMRSRFLMQ